MVFLHTGQREFSGVCLPFARCVSRWGEERRWLPVARLGSRCATQTRLLGSGGSRGAGAESIHFQVRHKGLENQYVPEEGVR